MKCPVCGCVSGPDSRFCKHCGADLTEAAAGEARSVRCPACGCDNDTGNRFCMRCGAPLPYIPPATPRPAPAKSGGMKRKTKIIILAICLAALVVGAFFAVWSAKAKAEKTAEDWQAQYKLGEKYMDEGNYKKAVIAYRAAIRIDPRRAEAYEAAARAYKKDGDPNSALKILDDGYRATGDKGLQDQKAGFSWVQTYYMNNVKMYEAQYENGLKIKETYFNDEGGSVTRYTAYEYDKDGNKIKEATYDGDGSVDSEYRYEYDEKGNMTRQTQYDGDGSVDSEYRYEYDEKGNMTRKTKYDGDGSVIWDWTYTYEYDDKGNETGETWQDSDGKSGYSIYEYDANGNQIRYTAHDDYGSYTDETNETYEYDAAGHKTKVSWQDSDDSGYEIFEYDANGNRTRDTWYNDDGSVNSYETYEYDADGHKTKETHFESDGSIDWTYIYAYDAEGRLIKEPSFYPDGGLYGYAEHEYDAYGNLITTHVTPN